MTGCLKVFPNPAKDQITITWHGSGIALVRVWSATGKLFLNDEYGLTNIELRSAAWPSGVYMVEVRTEDRGLEGEGGGGMRSVVWSGSRWLAWSVEGILRTTVGAIRKSNPMAIIYNIVYLIQSLPFLFKSIS